MYARSTTIQASPASIERGLTYMRDEAMPTVLAMDGCVGLSLLVDRDSGRCIVTSAWDSEQALRGTEQRVQPLRDEATRAFDATVESIQVWEIAVLHREHETQEGSCVRVSWLKGDASTIDRGIEAFRSRVLPTAEDISGFCSGSLMVDRATGRMAGATCWDDRKAMEASRDAATTLRTDTASEFGAQVEEVREFELAIAHLRVPELV